MCANDRGPRHPSREGAVLDRLRAEYGYTDANTGCSARHATRNSRPIRATEIRLSQPRVATTGRPSSGAGAWRGSRIRHETLRLLFESVTIGIRVEGVEDLLGLAAPVA